MNIFEQLVRRAARVIGWEIGSAIENVLWSVGIGIALLGCCACGAIAVAFQIVFKH